MSLFHIANDGNTLTMMSVSTGYAIERALDDIPADVQLSLLHVFNTKDLTKPAWTRTGVILGHQHPVYLWFLFEKSEQEYQKLQDIEATSAMSYYAKAISDPYVDSVEYRT